MSKGNGKWQFWDVNSASDVLHMKPNTLQGWIKQRRIKAYYIAGRYLIRNEDLEAFVESRAGDRATCGVKSKLKRRIEIQQSEDLNA